MVYEQIYNLKEDTELDRSKKGYVFEQLIREIQPWSFKPPIVTAAKSEQIDGIYIWDGNTYFIECKAKKDVIKRGSHDWEDFELKIRKRKGTVIGLFCSLNEIHDSVIEAATDLNKEGFTTLLLFDDFWRQIYEEQLDFSIVLNYLVLFARANFSPTPTDVSKIKKWYYGKEENTERIFNHFIKESSTFLSRFRRNDHDKLYVKRELDDKIVSFARQLRPSLLKKRFTEINPKKHYDPITKIKDLPNQFFLLRDSSGAGKTFFSIQQSMLRKDFVAIAKSASQNDIDDFDKCLTSLGKLYGINEIEAIDKPILLFIDSLDCSLPRK